jgi:hypothetical protein
VTTNGTGAERTISFTPQTDQQGDSVLEVCVNDGNLWSCQTFQVSVKQRLQWQNPIPQANRINDIWGVSETNIFIASQWGGLLHYDGISWNWMTSGTTEHINDLWGLDDSSIYAVGNNGSILHYDGTTWSGTTSGSNHFHGVWGVSENEIYAVSDNGGIFKYNGSGWSQVMWASGNLMAIWGYDEAFLL